MYKLSSQFGVSVDGIKMENGLKSDTLFIGQMLSIPSEMNQSGQESKKAIVTADVLNVRVAGGLNAKVISKIMGGTELQVLEYGEDWSKIKIGEVGGFVATRYLDFQPSNIVSRSGDMTYTRVLNIIKPLIGIPYKYGGTSPQGFDCSGFTLYVMKQFGANLPRTSAEQISVGKKVDRKDLQVGDLLFFDTLNQG